MPRMFVLGHKYARRSELALQSFTVQRSRRLQAGDYTAPVLPEVIPGDVVEVGIGVMVSFQFRGLYRGVCTVGVAFARIL